MNDRTLVALRTSLLTAALITLPVSVASAQASRIAMSEATAARQAQTEESARQTVQSLFERLCPGRCEIIQVRAVMGEPAAAAVLEPGFEDDAPQAYEGQVESLRVDILLDSALPGAFRQNIPRMLRYRLRPLAPVVEVRTESLAFPEPQLEPAPPVVREPPRAWAPPPPMPEPAPAPPPEPRAEPPAPTPEPEAAAPEDLWIRAIPWIGGILLALILAALTLILVRRLTQRADAAAPANVGAASPGSDLEARARIRREIEDALRDKRAAANAALRRWVVENPEAVARFVKLFGAETLKDLRNGDDTAPALARVARHLIAHPEPLTDAEEGTTLQEARARFAAAELEEGRSADWEFLEGLSTAQLAMLLENATVGERACVLAELSASARAAYVASLTEVERGELLVGATDGRLAAADVRRLQTRLRAAAEDLRGRRSLAGGGLVGDLIRSVAAAEQVALAERLLREQPAAGEALLDEVLLEHAFAYLPSGVIADASMQLPIETLVTFLAGTDPAIRRSVLGELAPRTQSAVSTELEVVGPIARHRFLEAREALASAIAGVMLREGHALRSANANALRSPRAHEHLEAAQ
jgi:flagellar motor switch protein FliG